MLTLVIRQGYVLIEYPTLTKAAIEGANGAQLLEQTVGVDFAFVRPPPTKGQAAGRGGRQGGRQRSRSPGVKRGGADDEGEVE